MPKKSKPHDSSEKKKSVNGVHQNKESKKRKHEDDATGPERKKKPKLNDGKEAQSSRADKSLDSSTKTPKSALTEKYLQKSGDQFMAALHKIAEKKKEKIHRQKPPTLPLSSSTEVAAKNEPSKKQSGNDSFWWE
ncbi:hypothetical protein AAVH_07801 [Aphelenchoides avenae]|nr:hypothetical protein AAVH_07801 [Aphelenchus avenae]